MTREDSERVSESSDRRTYGGVCKVRRNRTSTWGSIRVQGMQTREYIVLRYTEAFILDSFANIKARQIDMKWEKENGDAVCEFERIKKDGEIKREGQRK